MEASFAARRAPPRAGARYRDPVIVRASDVSMMALRPGLLGAR
jgi:hypothetical protein